MERQRHETASAETAARSGIYHFRQRWRAQNILHLLLMLRMTLPEGMEKTLSCLMRSLLTEESHPGEGLYNLGLTDLFLKSMRDKRGLWVFVFDNKRIKGPPK